MKNLIILSLLVIMLFLFSCNHKNNSALLPELARAESLMYAHPDSALQLLERMPVPSSSNRLQNATWCLLMTQARDKNNRKHTSDSLITIAYEYFKKQPNPQRKALAANYQGVVNGSMNNTEQAMQYYLEAAKEVEKTDDYRLAHLIFSNMGHIYLYRSLSDYAMPVLQKSYYYAKLSGDKSYVSYSLSSIARAYSIQSNWEKAIEYYKEAMAVAETAHAVQPLVAALSELSGIYARKGNYTLALVQAKKALIIKEKEHIPTNQSMLIIGNIYRSIGKSDSAFYYLHKAAESDNIYTLCSANQALFLLCKEKNNYKLATDYSEKIWIYSDSIQKMNRNKEVIEIQERYNQEKLLNEKNQLKIEKDHTVLIGLVLLVFLICVIAALIMNYQRKLLRKERTIQKNEEQIRLYTLRIHENESLMNRNKNRMEELIVQIEENKEVQEQWEEQQNALSAIQRQNEDLHQENAELQLSIGHYSKSVQERAKELDALKVLSDENSRSRDREKFLCNQLIRKTAILDSLKRSPKYLESGELYAVQEAINELFDSFTARLSRQIPLSEDDLQLCCLLKLRLTNSDIGTILNITADSVSKRKQRIKARIINEFGQDLGNKRTLDLFILEF